MLLLAALHPVAQQTFTVYDSLPVTVNGLQAGYSISSESEKEVGKKGDFSRFKIRFYLTNTSSQAQILYRKPAIIGGSGSLSPILALFKCTNATGARLTNKMASMEMQPCRIEATVEDKECGTDKTVQHVRQVDIGYWIKPGETITRTYPMIVPLNQKPEVTVTFYPENGSQTGSLVSTPDNNNQQRLEEFVRLKNVFGNTYIHNQNGPLACTDIDYNWWSAQWELVAVAGTNNFQIVNRWKHSYISTENSSLLSNNGTNSAAQWMIEEVKAGQAFYLRNAASGARLVIDNGQLKISNAYLSDDTRAQWIIEK